MVVSVCILPAGITQRLTVSTEIASRAPIAEAFANRFRHFRGRSEEDVARFIAQGEQVTLGRAEKAAKWKQDALDAGDEAEYAITVSKRALYVRGAAAEDEAFWVKEYEKADAEARRAVKLKREAAAHAEAANQAQKKFIDALKRLKNREEDSSEEVKRAEEESTNAQSVATNSKREADAAVEAASESWAIVSYALRVRASPEDINVFAKRDQTTAEMAMGLERRTRRESYFVSKAAREREAIHKRALKLQAEF